MTTNLIQSDSRNIYEGYLNTYQSTSNEDLKAIERYFVGEYWAKINRPSIESAGLDPFLLKEAYLKTLDRRGMARPDSGRFVEESEAVLDAPFWETGMNPVTMTKIHETYDWVEDGNKSVDYGYKY